jgi:hypothetical protein
MTFDEFNQELARLAGRTLLGQPRLRMIDASRETVWEAGCQRIKYVGHVAEDGTEVGEDRYIVEIWRSPEFLAASGRFTDQRHDDDGSELIREMPSEGHYDYMLRVPREDFATKSPAVLGVIKEVWEFQRLTLSEQNRLIDEHREQVEEKRRKAARERRNAEWGFDPDDYQIIATSSGAPKVVRKAKEI